MAAKTAAQKKLLADAQALLAKQKTRLAALEKQQKQNIIAKAEGLKDVGFLQQAAKEARTAAAASAPIVPVEPKTDIQFPKVGTLIRYESGATEDTRVAIYADGVGGEFRGEESVNPVRAGSTGGTDFAPERTLARDTFKNTLALLVGDTEATQPWVDEMYGLVSGFYKTGSTMDEAINYGLYEAKAKGLAPAFTKRFQGVFDLQDRLRKGEAIEVPTIAAFVKAQEAMGDTLREAGLGDLATQDFLGQVIGKGKSILEVGNLISDVFTAIDTAPAEIKKDMATYFPGVDRVQMAKAILTGEAGAAELKKKVAGVNVLSAARTQGVTVGLEAAKDIAARGVGYESALTGFGTVKELERAKTLSEFQGGTFSQEQAQKYVFEKSQEEKARLEKIAETEQLRFQGKAGTTASSLRGAAARTMF